MRLSEIVKWATCMGSCIGRKEVRVRKDIFRLITNQPCNVVLHLEVVE